MSSKRIGEILETSRTLHQDFHKFVSEKVKNMPYSRYSAALAYLDHVEKKTESMLSEVPEECREKVLNTFVRYYPIKWEDEAREIVDDCVHNKGANPMDAMVEMRRRLIEIYSFCARNAQLPEAAELMDNIYQFEEKQLLDISRQLSEYEMER